MFVAVAVLVVIILQLITILMVAGMKGKGRGPHHGHRRQEGQAGDSRPERKEGGQRAGGNNRKPGENRGGDRQQQPRQGGSGQRPQQQSQQVETDTSMLRLRDINMKLNNVNREQENVRKRIQDGSGGPREDRGPRDDRGPREDRGPRDGLRDGRPQNRGGSGNGSRDGRDRDGRGGDRGGRRDFNGGGQRRDGRPERPPREFEPKPEFDSAAPGATAPETMPQNIDAGAPEEMQHGRKFTAKRRQLPENIGGEGAPDAAADMPVPIPPPPEFTRNADAPVEQTQQDDEAAGIQFGRGRR